MTYKKGRRKPCGLFICVCSPITSMKKFYHLKKNILMLVMVPVLLGLVSLGARLPLLSGMGSTAPKPRPRTHLQNQIKTCNDRIEKHSHKAQQQAIVSPVYSLPGVIPQTQKHLSSPPHPRYNEVYADASSRASPCSPGPVSI